MINFLEIELEHPLINASGTFDAIAAVEVFGDALVENFPFSCYVTKTVTVEPRVGNEPRRLWEVAAGMINSIGLPNKGVEQFVAADLPRYAQLPVPLIVSIAGFSADQFKQLVTAFNESPDVDALELNISCPNVKSGCVYGSDSGETEQLLTALRPLAAKPLIVKLTPSASNLPAVAQAAERGGADAFSLINTLPAAAFDRAGKPALAAGSGGLSGPAIKPVALQQVRQVTAASSLPVVGMGGVSSGSDVHDFLQAGASLVAVGSENFRDPLAAIRIRSEMEAS